MLAFDMIRFYLSVVALLTLSGCIDSIAPNLQVTGRLEDSSGKPIRGARLLVVRPMNTMSVNQDVIATALQKPVNSPYSIVKEVTTTDADGRFKAFFKGYLSYGPSSSEFFLVTLPTGKKELLWVEKEGNDVLLKIYDSNEKQFKRAEWNTATYSASSQGYDVDADTICIKLHLRLKDG